MSFYIYRVSLVSTGAQNRQNKHWLLRGALLFISSHLRSEVFHWLVSAVTPLDATVSCTENQECSDFLHSKENAYLLFCCDPKMILGSKVAWIAWRPLTRLCGGSGSATCHVASYQLLSLVTAQHVTLYHSGLCDLTWHCNVWSHMTLHSVLHDIRNAM